MQQYKVVVVVDLEQLEATEGLTVRVVASDGGHIEMKISK
jgi:hypothetical protein